MSRLTVRLPQTLHERLVDLAENEGVSLNQYIVYALSQQATQAYTVHPVPESIVKEQSALYSAILNTLQPEAGTPEEIKQALTQREHVQPEAALSKEAVERLMKRIAEKNQAV